MQTIADNPSILLMGESAAVEAIRLGGDKRKEGLSDTVPLCDFYEKLYTPNVSETDGVSDETIKKAEHGTKRSATTNDWQAIRLCPKSPKS